jgi:four helix bundle protein
MSNIAEGFERDGSAEFRRFLTIAKGSVGEVRAQLYVALDNGFIDKDQFQKLHSQTEDVTRLIGGLMRYIAQRTDTRT